MHARTHAPKSSIRTKSNPETPSRKIVHLDEIDPKARASLRKFVHLDEIAPKAALRL
jgi:hypothetical protein